MADNRNKNQDQTEPTKRDLASKAKAQPNPEDYSNKANITGATDTGENGTRATASQQQGQGARNKKTDTRTGSDSGSGHGGHGGGSPTGK
ncbi:hypothetical protein CLV24_11554 [Pontibacter ummariensis]|uniref:Uncharacterized protein n=1 Tax=Pontibacter ummariensis TaxID=1610492 RepID=A0A239I2X9_9BACT|nr:hypothetical protein [Pontibacter ummariensis]PRY10137.1 hypothetical protein CLV24_11554 [Pontibacter ummariensis]SNS86694.1 hypothetical protein SAMN06296052_11554 [Pontibacter ummariensis]